MREKSGWTVQPTLHAHRPLDPDPDHEAGLAAHLAQAYPQPELIALYDRFAQGAAAFDAMMRRVIWRALARRFGHAVRIEPGALFRHLERIDIGDGVFIGAQSIIQGRFDGDGRIGARVWIGPQVFLDARALVIEDGVGIGAGARIVTSQHSGVPIDSDIIATDQLVAAVHIERGAQISTGAQILAGVRIGAGALIGAGAVVTSDIPPRVFAAGVPARVICERPTANRS